MKKTLEQLYNFEPLSISDSYKVLEQISKDAFNPAQVSAFICSYLMRDITVNELTGFRNALLDLCIPFKTEYDSIDLCGTGGDSKNTFNISTISSFIVAGSGIKVTKHGNYGVSSFCGSSNILESLGHQFSNNNDLLNKQLDKANICFLHAPLFHPAMKSVAGIRKQLGMKTFFNLLGPLVNPAQPKNQLIGVFSLKILRVYQLLHQNSDKNVTLVHTIDGYDEVSLTNSFKLVGSNFEYLHEPEEFNFTTYNATDISGGNNISDAKTIFLKILNNKATKAQTDVVLANAGIAIANFNNTSVLEGIEVARKSLQSGKALESLNLLLNTKS